MGVRKNDPRKNARFNIEIRRYQLFVRILRDKYRIETINKEEIDRDDEMPILHESFGGNYPSDHV